MWGVVEIPPSASLYLPLLYLLWQLYAPKYLGWETRFNEIIGGFNDRIDSVGERVDEVEQKQSKMVTVTEILAVTDDDIDGREVEIFLDDDDAVDKSRFVDDDRYGPFVADGGPERDGDE